MRLFDCHCHVHLGQRGISPLLESAPLPPPSKVLGLGDDDPSSFSSFSYAGAAIMSTHPRDYAVVDSAAVKLRARFGHGVPCYGVHPWFLHEVALSPPSSDVTSGDAECWLAELRRRLTDDPRAVVGEIGLDGARWREVGGDGDEHESVWNRERILSCPMDVQRKAFESQLLLAAELRRPTSIHVVRAWGELFDSLKSVRDQMEQKHSLEEEINSEGAEVEQGRSKRRRNKSKKKRKLLPPKIYFHAFSGKVGIIPSLLAACEKGNVPREDVYFGFPPAIPNFYSPKTPSVMRKIGIDQLVLETDLENASNVRDDLMRGAEGLAMALDLSISDVAEQTYRNAERLYFDHMP